MASQNKKKVKKVVKGLKKASKLHAKQAKTLSSLKLNKGGSTVNKAGNYTKPAMRKRQFQRIKAGGKGGAPDSGLHVKHRCLLQLTKKLVVDIQVNATSQS